MSGDPLSDRGRAVEEAFFAKQNEALRQRLRTSASTGSGMDGSAGQPDLLESGGDTAAALAMVPLVAMAWADGQLDVGKRAAVLQAATENGLDATGASYRLVEHWLAEKPNAALLTRWATDVRGLCDGMDGDRRETFRQHTLKQARRVAETAGGLPGGGRVCAAEQAVLDRLDAAFAR